MMDQDPKQLRRTRAGTRRNTYRPALRMLDRASEPFSLDHVVALSQIARIDPIRPGHSGYELPRILRGIEIALENRRSRHRDIAGFAGLALANEIVRLVEQHDLHLIQGRHDPAASGPWCWWGW